MELAGWISYKIIAYSVMPACAWAGAAIGTAVGTHVGKKIANNVLQTAKNKISGKTTITVKNSTIYIVENGKLVEINTRKKYIIEKGKLIVIVDDIYDLTDIEPISDGISNKSSHQSEEDENWVEI